MLEKITYSNDLYLQVSQAFEPKRFSGLAGLEPATFTLTTYRANQLLHSPIRKKKTVLGTIQYLGYPLTDACYPITPTVITFAIPIMAFRLYLLLVDLLHFRYAKVFLLIVRMRGIEPPTSSSQATRSNLLSYILIKYGVCRTRTCDPLINGQTL